MNLPNVIGICGKMGTGKDEVGCILEDNHGYMRTSFAEGLRKEVQKALCSAYWNNEKARKHFPIVPEEEMGRRALKAFEAIVVQSKSSDEIEEEPDLDFGVWAKPTSPDIRILLQWWGTEYRRAEDEDYWVKKWLTKWITVLLEGTKLCITDVRYDNEAQMCKLMGAIWEVYGRGIEDEGLKDHASEEGVSLVFDRYIPNHGTLDYLAWVVSLGLGVK